jgi:hypothetical protein
MMDPVQPRGSASSSNLSARLWSVLSLIYPAPWMFCFATIAARTAAAGDVTSG